MVINNVYKMDDNRIHEIIREEVDALEFFGNLNHGHELTPWNHETKMDRMHPSRASRSNGSMSPNRDVIYRGYDDWDMNYRDRMSYPDYCKMFGIRR